MASVYKFGGSPELDKEEEEIINKISNDFILRDGGNQFLGTLDMGINKISRVVDPIDSQDVATKKYVDDGNQSRDAFVSALNTYLGDLNDYVSHETINIIQSPQKKLVISTEDGNVEDTAVAVEDLVLKSSIADVAIPKLESPTGDKYLVSTSDGKVVESPKNYVIEYNFRKLAGGSRYQMRTKGQTISKLSLAAGLYRVTLNSIFLKNTLVHDLALPYDKVWPCIYDKGKLNIQNKRAIFRALAFNVGNEYNIFYTGIMRIPNIEDAEMRIFEDIAVTTAITTRQDIYFYLEKLE